MRLPQASRASFLLCGALVLGLGAFLRLWGLGDASLWMDEGFTWFVASQPWSRLPEATLFCDKHPPLWHATSHVMLWLGQSELLMRIPAAVAGIITVYVTRRLAMEAGSGRVAWTAALLLSVSSMHVLASRDARCYGLACLLATTSTWLWWRELAQPGEHGLGHAFWRGWREGDADRRLACYFAVSLAAMYTHYYCCIVLAMQWLGSLVAPRRPPLGRWGSVVAALALCYLPWLPTLVAQARVQQFELPGGRWTDFAETLFAQSVGFSLNFKPFLGWPLFHWYVVAGIGLVVGGAAAWKGSAFGRYLGVVFFGYVATIVLVAIATGKPFFAARYTVLVTPAFWVLMAVGAWGWSPSPATVREEPRPRFLTVALVTFWLCLNLVSDYNFMRLDEWGRQDWRWASQVLVREARGGDLVLVEPHFAWPAMAYYLQPGSATLPVHFPTAGVDLRFLGPEQVVSFGPADLHGRRQVFLVESCASLSDPGGRVRSVLEATAGPASASWISRRRNGTFTVTVMRFSPR